MSSTRLHSLAFAALLSLGGCIVHGHAVAHADASAPHFVFHEPPTLVAIEPGVWVVHDYHAQIFLVGDVYWHLDGGVWYRAVFYDGDWVAVATTDVPIEIRDVEEEKYVDYEGDPDAERVEAPPAHAAAQHGGPPGHREEPGLRRGHEDPADASMPDTAPPPGHDDDGPGNSEHAPGHDDAKQDDAKHDNGNADKGEGKGPKA